MSRPTPAQQLGKRIQALRKAAGMNQYQLADRLGMSRSAVAFWETGRESSARKHIPRLARLFGVSEEAFLTDQHDESHEMTLTSDEHDLLVLYRMLDATDKLSAQKWIEKRVVRQGQ
ncbi:helix-turn-helix transcriptional regulator [Nguyenibacter vanlangensis]|nr:helix-turn-helix transcriptional regulator [Nguyenibacter vanlangensis]